MNVSVVVQPPFEPVTLAEVYAHLRLTPDHAGSPSEATHPDDDMLSRHIATARKFVEQASRRSLVQQTLRLSVDDFPRNFCRAAVERIYVRRPPIIRIEQVSYFDADNAQQVVDPADYYLADGVLPELRFSAGFYGPAMYDRPDALRVDYVAGYAPGASPTSTQEDYAANVPAGLKDAVLLGVQLLYDNLSDSDRNAVERLRESLIQPFRIQLP